MPSIKQTSEYLQRAKDEGKIKPIPSPVPGISPSHAPDQPSYPEAPNSRLRSPLPAVLVQQPDSQRQWFNASVPQTRLLAPTLSMSPFAGSAIQSQISSGGTGTGTTGTIPVPVVPPPPTAGQFYEVNSNGNFETMYSRNGIIL